MKVEINQLKIKHLEECIELDKKTFKGIWTSSQWERELCDPNRICIGAFESDTQKLIGLSSGWLILDELHVTILVVHPLYIRKGIGRLILSNLIYQSKSLGINLIKLEAKDTNDPAKALYKKIGFKVKGYRPNFYKDGSNALIFEKSLN